MSWILGAIKIIIVLGTLITIHELGHFLVAKACNMKVHKFAIGFGPKLFRKTKGETEYTIRLIPFGGFVQLEGEEIRSEDPRAFNNKPVWQRMLVIVAGATVNIFFALIIYYCVCMSDGYYTTSTISDIDINSTVYEAGIREGDKILKINNKRTVTRNHVEDIISDNENNEYVFEIERNEERLTIPVRIPTINIGVIGAGFDKNLNITIIAPNQRAEAAGLKINDKVISIDDIEMASNDEITNYIKSNPEKEIKIKVLREDKEEIIAVTPKASQIKDFNIRYVQAKDLNFFENSYYAIDETGYFFLLNVKGIAELFTGKAENVAVMGPVGIANEISSTETFSSFFYLMSAISLSLGIFNLLPIPALDGGKFVLLLVEGIRRKPLSEKVEIGLQLAGLTAIMLLAIIVTFSDVIKLF